MKPAEYHWSTKGQAQGQMQALNPGDVQAIREHLAANASPRDRALFALGLDCMLRGGDLCRLRVAHLVDHGGGVRESFTVVQGKISGGKAHTVTVYLTLATRELVAALIARQGKSGNDYLFTGKGRNEPLSTDQLRILVKSWVAAVGLDPNTHANHTLRRTKATALYKATRDIELVRRALGHAYVSSTQAYLSVGSDEVRAACLSLKL
jgi:integrase